MYIPQKFTHIRVIIIMYVVDYGLSYYYIHHIAYTTNIYIQYSLAYQFYYCHLAMQ